MAIFHENYAFHFFDVHYIFPPRLSLHISTHTIITYFHPYYHFCSYQMDCFNSSCSDYQKYQVMSCQNPHLSLHSSHCLTHQNLLYWSKRSACDQRSNLGRPLFLVLIFSLTLLTPLTNIPEGVVVGFQIFAWAPR